MKTKRTKQNKKQTYKGRQQMSIYQRGREVGWREEEMDKGAQLCGECDVHSGADS